MSTDLYDDLYDLIEGALKRDGYDGLCNPGLDCGCRIGDLCPCDEPSPLDCRPGFRGPAPNGESTFGIYLCREAAKKENSDG